MRRMAGEEHVNPGTARSTKFTYDDFVHFPNDGKRHEIIDGEHYVTPSPNTKHQVVVGNLHLSIGGHLRERQIGFVFLAPFDVVFSHFDVVEPDLLYISRERMRVLTKAHVRGAPDLWSKFSRQGRVVPTPLSNASCTNVSRSRSTGSLTLSETW
jgi:hypothetical protein